MSRRIALLLPACAIAGATALVAAAPSPAAATPRCHTSGLSVSVSPLRGGGAAGSIGYGVYLRNRGAHTCRLFGYPGVSFVDAHGTQVGPAASRSGATPHTVRVAPGARAGALLLVAEAGNFGSACHERTTTGVRVYPPDERASRVATRTLHVCRDRSVGRIGPVQTAAALRALG